MKYRVLITKKAWDDIEQAYFWLAARSLEAAERWRDALFEVIDTLQQFPERVRVLRKVALLGPNCVS